MHAKRTRDRKRLFMEEMAEMCKRLEEENALLQSHLQGLDGDHIMTKSVSGGVPSLVSSITPTVPSEDATLMRPPSLIPGKTAAPVSEHGVTVDQIQTLLDAAVSFDQPVVSPTKGHAISSAVSAVSASSCGSSRVSDDDHDDAENDSTEPAAKRRRVEHPSGSLVPTSITTKTAAV